MHLGLVGDAAPLLRMIPSLKNKKGEQANAERRGGVRPNNYLASSYYITNDREKTNQGAPLLLLVHVCSK
jgi:hypothetical protein